MNQKKDIASMNSSQAISGTVVYDEKKKLSELQSIILRKGDQERTRILEDARAEKEKWLSENNAQLDKMIDSIRNDAVKRAHEITTRHLIEAEAERDKGRLRLQGDLIFKALAMLQESLVAFSTRPDYDLILTGMAAEVLERLPKGQDVKMSLRAEDISHGAPVANALSKRFPELHITFDEKPASILGGVVLFSEEEKWRVVTDWKSKVEEMTDAVAKAVLAEL